MALTSTLYTGLSGLDVNQTKLNVVGNNISNANTTAFKSSRAIFSPQFYITTDAGSAPSSTSGGANPSQVGLGAVVSSIQRDFTDGTIEPTGKATDLAIDGSGFFIVENGSNQFYTRDGSFVLNANNELTTATGGYVQGFGVDSNATVIPGQLDKIQIPLGASTLAQETTNVEMAGNFDASGDVGAGSSILLTQELTVVGGAASPTGATLLTNVADASSNATAIFTSGDVITMTGQKGGRDTDTRTFTVTAASTIADLQTFLQGSMGVDPSAPTPTGVVPAGTYIQAGVTANSVQLALVGNVGAENSLAIQPSGFVSQSGLNPLGFTDGTLTAATTGLATDVTSDPSGESVHTSFIAYDSLGTPVTIDVTAVLETKADTGNVWRFFASSPDDTDTTTVVGNGTLTFDANGKLKASTGTSITIDRSATGAGTPITTTLDFSGVTSLTSASSTLTMTKQNGSAMGTLNDFSIGSNGIITGQYSNGRTRTLGQIAVATFNNPQGLIDKGTNMFVESTNSGVAIITPPEELSAGSIRAGSLELSNVDLSEEFINMIVASTGFSAASRVITTSDQLINELLNTSR